MSIRHIVENTDRLFNIYANDLTVSGAFTYDGHLISPTGNAGPTGPTGPTGPIGPTGSAPSLTGYISTLDTAPDADSLITYSGTGIEVQESSAKLTNSGLNLVNLNQIYSIGTKTVVKLDNSIDLDFRENSRTHNYFNEQIEICDNTNYNKRLNLLYDLSNERGAITSEEVGVGKRDLQVGTVALPCDLYIMGTNLVFGANVKLSTTQLNNQNNFPTNSGQLATRADCVFVDFNGNLNNITPSINSRKLAVFTAFTITKLNMICTLNANNYNVTMDLYENGALIISSNAVIVTSGTALYAFTFASTTLSSSKIYQVVANSTVSPGDTLVIENGFLYE